MGQAAREKAKRRRYFKRLAETDPQRFAFEWEKRLSSWAEDIRRRGRDWQETGTGGDQKIFGILDEAMTILLGCERTVREAWLTRTYSFLCHECCRQVAWAVDPRLYRLSLTGRLPGGPRKIRRTAMAEVPT